MNAFELLKRDTSTKARLGIINTAHGPVRTPAFLPIGTRGSVKAVTTEELKFWGAEMVLCNTYHLWLRPGDLLIRKAGGLHKFMGWEGPIFTDSGGFQVFSLGEKSKKTLKMSDHGVEFRDELEGKTRVLTPEESINIQANLGSDIALVLDDVPGLPADEKRLGKSLDLTLRWAERAKRHHERVLKNSVNPGQKLYGIVQGGDIEQLRKRSVAELRKLDFDGYAVGGLAVGESAEIMYKVLNFTVPHLEEDKPRHLLGVGTPEQIVEAVARGIDTFDCVLPTRNARHGMLYINSKTSPLSPPHEEGMKGEVSSFYDVLNITNSRFADDFTPPDNTCSCYLCLHHTRAYLRHLFQTGEPLAIRLATMHNLRFYLDLMARIRRAIEFESFAELEQDFAAPRDL